MSDTLQTDPSLVPQSGLSPLQPRSGLFLTGILALVLTVAIAYLEWGGLWPFLLSVAGTGVVGWGAVPLLRRLKAGQVIREDGPQSHLTKAGTPTMGGIYLIPVGLVIALVWTYGDRNVIAASLLTLAYTFVGWLDDWQVIRQQSNQGLSPRQKLGLQVVMGVAFCGWLAWTGVGSSVALPGLGSIPLSWGFWPLALFVLVGTNNSVNLTDGMDGLAAGMVAILLVGLSVIVAPQDPNLTIFGLCLAGSCLGFLLQNRHPAQVFMGDTGSLGLGGALAAIALMSNSLWALALMGAVLVAESLSVIAQVSYFKYTRRKTGQGQRLLKMAPLHHHLELSGWPEIRVVGVLYVVGALLALVGGVLSRL